MKPAGAETRWREQVQVGIRCQRSEAGFQPEAGHAPRLRPRRPLGARRYALPARAGRCERAPRPLRACRRPRAAPAPRPGRRASIYLLPAPCSRSRSPPPPPLPCCSPTLLGEPPPAQRRTRTYTPRARPQTPEVGNCGPSNTSRDSPHTTRLWNPLPPEVDFHQRPAQRCARLSTQTRLSRGPRLRPGPEVPILRARASLV